MKLARISLVLLVAATLALTGCSKGRFSQENAPKEVGVFRYSLVTTPTTLDPHKVEDGDTIDLLQQVYETLVKWGEDSRVKPNLAESWDMKDDGTTYVFHLRKGVKFHNGRDMTADDVKWSFERATNPDLASPIAATYLDNIVGVREKLARQAKEVSGIVVNDPNTITIKIDKPRAYFLDKLTYLCGAVIPKDSAPANKDMTELGQMIGTGPFKWKSYVDGQLAVVEANPAYHDGAPLLKEIRRPIIKDAATRLIKFKSGEIDLVQLERQDVAALQKDPKFASQLKFYDRPSIYYVGMGENSYPPFKDKRVRQAFAMAIDKKTIVEEILGGVNRIANGILPPNVLGHRENAKVYEYDPATAKKLLAEAGFPDGKGLPPLEFNFRDSRPDIKLVAEAVASQLKTNLGVSTNTRSIEWTAYLEKRNRKELQLFHMRWAADYLDPENFLSLMLSTTGAENKIGYSNTEFDALCAKADTMPTTDERLKLYEQAEDIVLQDAPWVPIYFQRDAELISPRVKGLRESLFGHLPHTTVTIE